MKYGEALPQRSVLEWLPYNLDYTELKQLIKHYTTGKPPVTQPELKTAFEDELYELLIEQLGRIDLFVRSKTGEIDRRTANCIKQITVLQTRAHLHPKSSKNTGRLEKVVREIERASYELQLLSRYVNVQRTGFHKLLKKYKKWTSSISLSNRFLPVLESPTAFHRLDFEANVLQVSELLNAARCSLTGEDSNARIMNFNKEAAVDNRIVSAAPIAAQGPLSTRPRSQSQLELDTALITSPAGGKAVFWVHPDHLIEIQIILLKHLVLQASALMQSLSSSPSLSRRNSTASTSGKDDDVGFVVLDDIQDFSGVQGAATVDKINQAGMRTSGQVRWCSHDSDAVVVVSDFADAILDGRDNPGAHKFEVKVRKSNVERILDLDSEYPESESQDEGQAKEISCTRSWLKEHPRVIPLVKVLSKRIRFTGKTCGDLDVCAVLDKDIRMTRVKAGRGWMIADDDNTESRVEEYTYFPHIVCEVQWQGSQTPRFVKELIDSHMVEHVPGFSLGVHAVAALYQPVLVTPPYWLQLLQKDIRKTPTPEIRRNRRSFSNHHPNSSKNSSTTGTTPSIRRFSTDFAEASTPPTSASGSPSKRQRNKEYFDESKKKLLTRPALPRVSTIGGTRYWNEFDDEDAEEEPYTVLVHRKTSVEEDDFEDDSLSQYLMNSFIHAVSKLGRMFHHAQNGPTERTPLLRKSQSVHSETSSELDIERGQARSTEQLRYGTRGRTAFMTSHIGSLAISVTILVVTAVMAFTSSLGERRRRKKHIGRGVVLDVGVFVGVLVSLAFAIAGLTVFLTSRTRTSFLHTTIVWIAFGAVSLGGGCIFALVGSEAGGP